DLDLVLMGDLVLRQPDLEVPHPRFRERRFVLEPLAAIAPGLTDPVTGRSMHELLRAMESSADQSLRSRASRLQAPGPADAR
ncbi:MAG: 2-amino-4-hydroxy-6-hydroxymethyldihydropteridine diphosphokinase, partial [Acidobacteria bacterium]|nr:2-amino-4-hydroxy-6-hydroxymethyldihydropteridine diphosphokinase [Acidobacteriota bacterium]